MKRYLSIVIGLLMIMAILVGSGEPSPEASSKSIIISEVICILIIAGGAMWFYWVYGRDEIR